MYVFFTWSGSTPCLLGVSGPTGIWLWTKWTTKVLPSFPTLPKLTSLNELPGKTVALGLSGVPSVTLTNL